MRVHAFLAGFFLPAGVMFFATGALYTWGAKGAYEVKTSAVALEVPLSKDDKDMMHELVSAQLAQRALEDDNPSSVPTVWTLASQHGQISLCRLVLAPEFAQARDQ